MISTTTLIILQFVLIFLQIGNEVMKMVSLKNEK